MRANRDACDRTDAREARPPPSMSALSSSASLSQTDTTSARLSSSPSVLLTPSVWWLVLPSSSELSLLRSESSVCSRAARKTEETPAAGVERVTPMPPAKNPMGSAAYATKLAMDAALLLALLILPTMATPLLRPELLLTLAPLPNSLLLPVCLLPVVLLRMLEAVEPGENGALPSPLDPLAEEEAPLTRGVPWSGGSDGRGDRHELPPPPLPLPIVATARLRGVEAMEAGMGRYAAWSSLRGANPRRATVMGAPSPVVAMSDGRVGEVLAASRSNGVPVAVTRMPRARGDVCVRAPKPAPPSVVSQETANAGAGPSGDSTPMPGTDTGLEECDGAA